MSMFFPAPFLQSTPSPPTPRYTILSTAQPLSTRPFIFRLSLLPAQADGNKNEELGTSLGAEEWNVKSGHASALYLLQMWSTRLYSLLASSFLLCIVIAVFIARTQLFFWKRHGFASRCQQDTKTPNARSMSFLTAFWSPEKHLFYLVPAITIVSINIARLEYIPSTR